MNEGSRPVCDYCDRPVAERFWYVINGDVICKGCLNENFRRAADHECDDEDDDDEGDCE